jgi:two-component sensor histidine kinase
MPLVNCLEIPSSESDFPEARLLLREFSHRVNNEFASAIAAISIAATRSASVEAEAALSAVRNQLQSYAQVHQCIADAGTYYLHRRSHISPTTMCGNQPFKT